MNMLRHIFSFKLVVVCALVALLGAVPKLADARRIRSKCPCRFATLYETSIAQAKTFGLTNKVDVCFKDSDQFSLEGGEAIDPDPCFAGMGVFDLTTTPVCDYLYVCENGSNEALYAYFVDEVPLSPKEVEACRAELELIAWLGGLFPCQAPPAG